MNEVEYLEAIVRELVEHPEGVSVSRSVDEQGVLLSMRVHADDMGRVIGREGSTAKAIRLLARCKGKALNMHVNVKIEEPDGSTYEPPRA